MLKKLRHIGIMVDNFQEALEKFKGFGLACSETREDKPLDLLIGFLSIGEASIELLHDTKPDIGGDPISSVVRDKKEPSTISASKSTTWTLRSVILRGMARK